MTTTATLLASKSPMPGNTIWVTGQDGTQYRGLLLTTSNTSVRYALESVGYQRLTDEGRIGDATVSIWYWLHWVPAKTSRDLTNLPEFPLVIDYTGALVLLDFDELCATEADATIVFDQYGRLHQVSALTFWTFQSGVVVPEHEEVSSRALADLRIRTNQLLTRSRAELLLTAQDMVYQPSVLTTDTPDASPRALAAMATARAMGDLRAQARLASVLREGK